MQERKGHDIIMSVDISYKQTNTLPNKRTNKQTNEQTHEQKHK